MRRRTRRRGPSRPRPRRQHNKTITIRGGVARSNCNIADAQRSHHERARVTARHLRGCRKWSSPVVRAPCTTRGVRRLNRPERRPARRASNPRDGQERSTVCGGTKGARCRDRTCGLRFRKPSLYPTELSERGQSVATSGPNGNRKPTRIRSMAGVQTARSTPCACRSTARGRAVDPGMNGPTAPAVGADDRTSVLWPAWTDDPTTGTVHNWPVGPVLRPWWLISAYGRHLPPRP